MSKFLLRSLLLDGGLCVDTAKGGPGSPTVLRTLIQIDGGAVTFADVSQGAGDPETLARHGDAVRRAVAPLLDTFKRIETVATAVVFGVSALAAWLSFLQQDAVRQVLAIAIAQVLAGFARWAFPRVFLKVSKFFLQLYLRHYCGFPAA